MTPYTPLFKAADVEPEPWSVTDSGGHWRPLQETLPAYGSRSEVPGFGAVAQPSDALSPEAARAAGYAEGMQRGQEEIGHLRERLHAAIAQLDDVCERQVRNCEADMARLALVIAEEVVLAELPARQAFTLTMAQHALQLLAASTSVTLRLSPADAVHLRASQPELCARPGLRLVEDAALQPGGVVAESPEGRVDASVAERLRAMARALNLPAQAAR
jgi:flagellar biosynthesis/type III secretory pathway protein FliH